MARTLRLTRAARQDLDGAERSFKRPAAGPVAAAKLARVRNTLLNVRVAPCSYRNGVAGMRLMIVAQHRVVYEVIPDTADNATAGNIRVVRIYGPAKPAFEVSAWPYAFPPT